MERESGPLREREERESESTRPSLQETPSQPLQCGAERFHEDKMWGFEREALKERRASVSGLAAFRSEMAVEKRKSR